MRSDEDFEKGREPRARGVLVCLENGQLILPFGAPPLLYRIPYSPRGVARSPFSETVLASLNSPTSPALRFGDPIAPSRMRTDSNKMSSWTGL